MSAPIQFIEVHPDAPRKPAEGTPCNGCGVCCLAEPCPLGMILTRRRRGPCMLLEWDGSARNYRCGALRTAVAWRPRWVSRLAGGLVRRWIGAGVGCDASLDTHGPP